MKAGTYDALASVQTFAVLGGLAWAGSYVYPLAGLLVPVALGACGFLAYGTAQGWGEREDGA